MGKMHKNELKGHFKRFHNPFIYLKKPQITGFKLNVYVVAGFTEDRGRLGGTGKSDDFRKLLYS